MRRRRLNWVVRWGGMAACAAVLTLYAVNLRWGVRWWPVPRLLLAAANGGLTIRWFEAWMSSFSGDVRAQAGVYPNFSDAARSTQPWIWWPHREKKRGPQVAVATPYWVLLGLAAIPTALAWRSERRRRRAGGCASCGYDLRGVPAGAVCPECGGKRA